MKRRSTLIYSVILVLSLLNPVAASDVDTEAYVIYVDPVTGIETTKKISSTATGYDWHKIIFWSAVGGLVIISGLLVAGFILRRINKLPRR